MSHGLVTQTAHCIQACICHRSGETFSSFLSYNACLVEANLEVNFQPSIFSLFSELPQHLALYVTSYLIMVCLYLSPHNTILSLLERTALCIYV